MKQLFGVLLICISHFAYANDEAEIDKLAEPVLALFDKEDYKNIASTALSGSTISDYISRADLKQSDDQFHTSFNIMGKFHSSQLLYEHGIEGTFIARWYLLKFSRQPVMLHFEFYRADKKWEVHSLQIKTDLDDYMEEHGKFEIGRIGAYLSNKN